MVCNSPWLPTSFSLIFLLFAAFLTGQQTPDPQASQRPKKVLTPAQKAYQQQWKEYMVKLHDLQARAKHAFENEMAREKARPCAAGTTYDLNVCLSKELTTTEENLKSYEGAVHDVMASAPKMPGESDTNMRGRAGPILTSSQRALEFEALEQSWRRYRDAACRAAYHQFSGGSGGPNFEMQCGIALARSHMRELDILYDGELHR